MSDATAQRARAQDEAARWFAQMSRASVTTEALREFRAWRRDAANAAAYAQIEATWDTAAALSADPEIAALTAATLRRRPPRAAAATRRPRWPLGLLAAGAMGVAAVAGGLAVVGHPYSTGVGEQRLVVLADGSRVRLNTDSAIRVRYGPAERRLRLTRGEAFFEVAHNPDRPFVVEADGARVTALPPWPPTSN
jgi:transmembrane sensor